jgi:hypothetical protein
LEKDTEVGELNTVKGLEYGDPNPPDVHGYTLVYGAVVEIEPAISVPVLDQDTDSMVCSIDGLLYKEPNPEDH